MSPTARRIAGGLSFVLTLAIVAASAYVLLGRDGQQARERQARAFPAVCQVVIAAYYRGEVRTVDVRDYFTGAPGPCPGLTPELRDTLNLPPRATP